MAFEIINLLTYLLTYLLTNIGLVHSLSISPLQSHCVCSSTQLHLCVALQIQKFEQDMYEEEGAENFFQSSTSRNYRFNNVSLISILSALKTLAKTTPTLQKL